MCLCIVLFVLFVLFVLENIVLILLSASRTGLITSSTRRLGNNSNNNSNRNVRVSQVEGRKSKSHYSQLGVAAQNEEQQYSHAMSMPKNNGISMHDENEFSPTSGDV